MPMATELGTAYVSVWPKLDGSQWASQINQALGNAGESGGKKLGSGISSGLSSAKIAIGNILANVASAGINSIRNSLDSAISRVDTLNNFPKVMSNIGFSTEEANKTITKLGEGIDGLPTTLDGIVSSTQAFALSLGDLGKASDVALAVNDGMLAFGASSEGASEAVRQLNQMITTGTFDMQSWNSINSAAPGFLDSVARSMLGEKATASELRDALNDGKISTDDFLSAIVMMDKEGGAGFASFAQLARESTGGIATSMANMKTAITKNLANIIDAINGSGGIAKLFDGFKTAINGVGKAILPLAEIVGDVFSSLIDKVTPYIDAFADRCGTFASSFREAFQETNDVFLAFIYGLQDAFSGTALEGFFNTISQAVQAFMVTVRDGGSTIDGLKAALGEIPPGALAAVGAIASIGGAVGIAKVTSDATQAAKSIFKIGEEATLAASKLPVVGNAFKSLNNSMTGFHSSVTNAGGGLKGLVATMSGGFNTAMNGARNAMLNFSTSVAMAGGGFKGLMTTIGGMMGPVGIAIAAVAALVGVFALLYNTNDQFRESMNQLGAELMAQLQPAIDSIMQSFQEMASAVMPALIAVVQALIPVITMIMTTLAQLAAAVLPMLGELLASILVPAITMIASVLSAIMPIIANILAFVVSIVSSIISLVMPVIQAIVEVISVAMPVIQSVIETCMNAILSVVQAVWPVVQAVIETAMNIIQDVINIVMAAINGDWEGVWNGIKQLANDIWEGIKSIISAAIEAVLNVIQTILDTISSIWNSIWQAICDFAGSIWDTICSIVQSAIDLVSSVIDSALNTIADWWNETWSTASEFISSTWSTICDTVSSGVDSVINFIGDIPGKIMEFFADAGNWLINAGRSILDGLLSGLKQAWDGVTSFIGGIGSWIVSNKGPESYDKKMLIPAGKWIMGGLNDGLQSGFKQVKSSLYSMTDEIAAFNSELQIGMDTNWDNLPKSTELLGTLATKDVFSNMAQPLTKDDVFDAFVDAYSDTGGQPVNLYIDGKLVATSISGYMDSSLQVIANRRGRF